jgi:cytochrome c553
VVRLFRVAGGCAATLLFAAPAAADEQLAAYLAGTCNTCHHSGGEGAAIPALAGRDAVELMTLLQAYRDGARPDALMHVIAGSLSETETAEVAAYLARQEPIP